MESFEEHRLTCGQCGGGHTIHFMAAPKDDAEAAERAAKLAGPSVCPNCDLSNRLRPRPVKTNDAPNTVHWRVGCYVIHDCDAKKAEMLMQVVGFSRDGYVRTRYVNGARVGRGVYANPMAVLHDPARFGIAVPGDGSRQPAALALAGGRA